MYLFRITFTQLYICCIYENRNVVLRIQLSIWFVIFVALKYNKVGMVTFIFTQNTLNVTLEVDIVSLFCIIIAAQIVLKRRRCRNYFIIGNFMNQ